MKFDFIYKRFIRKLSKTFFVYHLIMGCRKKKNPKKKKKDRENYPKKAFGCRNKETGINI